MKVINYLKELFKPSLPEYGEWYNSVVNVNKNEKIVTVTLLVKNAYDGSYINHSYINNLDSLENYIGCFYILPITDSPDDVFAYFTLNEEKYIKLVNVLESFGKIKEAYWS